MIKNIINQLSDTGDENWEKRSCGICVLKMLMVFKKPELENIPVRTLIDQALERNGYIENIGWRHQSIVDLASLHGVQMDFQKDFFNTPEKRKKGIKIIDHKIKSGAPVAVSVLKNFDESQSAHLVIVNGFKKFGPLVLGYKIVDPYPGKNGNSYFVSRSRFIGGWRGGMLWLK